MNAEVKTLLLVDDEPANIQIVNSILKDIYKTRIATSGAKALELANQTPAPDLILLDVMMPEMDGYEVCSRLKSADHTRDIPVIFLTGQTEIDDETKGFEVGAVDYIHKPFSPAVVQARVRTHLMLRGIREQLARQLQSIQCEMDTARQIQLSILPREIPVIRGLDISARYLPMTAVAGDFYDFIPIDEKRIGILVADVSGHGMPAALISSMLKIALDGQIKCALEPARVLAGLNRTLCGKFQGHFVTAVYVVVDTERQSLLYAGAGHPPLIFMDHSAGKARDFVENGLFLGFFPEATYTAVEIPFKAGDWGVLYTDGILEMTDPSDEQFGLDRFKQFLQDNHDLSTGQFVDELLEALSQWSNLALGREPEDDITLLAFHFGRTAG
ncbi:response regulator receiver domain-containing protein [Edaphobacter aggregans]|uniref:Response regulator receiver domain-containing protein n=1 Tax=Edaphobacter aggregans TaxID=570835 RepID=A0A3R9Q892_9BACT|nr:SpoIIE family protein phosphatase [Edaphobacter aggregans]RSL15627.1 response regulator receiver domain-containing protein [Edaphobacter aggregans]